MINIDDDYYHISSTGKIYLFLDKKFNDILNNIVFHPDTYCICFDDTFNKPLEYVIWPQNLTCLYFKFDFNQPLDNVNFPNSLRTLSLLGTFDQPLENVKILDIIDTFEISHMFNHSLTNIKFSNLEVFRINNHILKTFNFPPSLKHIIFGPEFTIPFSEVILPDSIKYISFCESSSIYFDFNKIHFPKLLEKLYLPTKKICFHDIKYMVISNSGFYVWNNITNLPNTLEELTIANVCTNMTNLPSSLKNIYINNTDDNLSHLTKLPFCCKLYDINCKKEIIVNL